MNVEDFSYAFSSTKISSIPEDTFYPLKNATNFLSVFDGLLIRNDLLTETPSRLFPDNARNIAWAFADRYNLKTIKDGLIDNCYSNVEDAYSMFSMSGTGSIEHYPDWWNRYKKLDGQDLFGGPDEYNYLNVIPCGWGGKC